MSTTIIGLDLAKNVFQVRGVDAKDKTVLRKRLRRSEMPRFFAALAPCVIGIEACGSGHHWARELQRFGHQVRLMPPQYVRPYVKTNKHDAADAEAICEAVQRPRMRFVPIKGADQQAALLLHRARELLLRQRTMLANAIRAHAAEFGLVVAKGIHRVPELGPVDRWRGWMQVGRVWSAAGRGRYRQVTGNGWRSVLRPRPRHRRGARPKAGIQSTNGIPCRCGLS